MAGYRAGERRIGAGLLLLAIAAFWFGASYGLKAPFYYGHYGFHGGSYATWARGTIRHHTVYPVNEPGFSAPRPHTYYVHHPVLTHQLVTLTFLLFGQHEWSVRLGALIPSFASLLLVAAIAWRHASPLAGGAAALVFAVVPVNIWYESHIDQGFPSIACLLAFFWFYLGWLRSGRWRVGIAALGFQLLAGNFEWSPYFAYPAIFAHVLWTALRRRGRYLAFAVLHPLTAIVPLTIHAYLVSRANLLTDMMAAYRSRTSAITYQAFSSRMREYADTLFGRALLVAMLLWLLLVTVRFLRGRGRALDLVGITFAFALITYMHVFKNAVVTHAYRQLYGNVWAAMAVAGLVVAARDIVDRFSASRSSTPSRAGTVVALGVLVVTTALTVGTSWAGLLESRFHGGVPGWKKFDPDMRQTAFAIEVQRTTRPGDVLHFHSSFAWPPPHRMDWAFYYDRDLRRWASLRGLLSLTPSEQRRAVVIVHPDELHGDELRAFAELGARHPVWQIQNLAAIDLRVDGARRDAYRLGPVLVPPPGVLPGVRRWLEGPYPFPKLIRDPVAVARLEARIKEGAALRSFVPSDRGVRFGRRPPPAHW